MDGVEMWFGSRGSQGWTVPGGSVPVCGSVRDLITMSKRSMFSIFVAKPRISCRSPSLLLPIIESLELLELCLPIYWK